MRPLLLLPGLTLPLTASANYWQGQPLSKPWQQRIAMAIGQQQLKDAGRYQDVDGRLSLIYSLAAQCGYAVTTLLAAG